MHLSSSESESGSRAPARNAHEEAHQATVIPGSSEQAAQDVQEVSPEGRPGDPKAGPAKIRAERVVAVVLIVGVVALSSIWLGWFGLVLGLVIGGLALAFNPVMAAAGQRAEDREEVIERRIGEGPTREGPRLS